MSGNLLGFFEKFVARKLIHFNNDYLMVKDKKFHLISSESLADQYLSAVKIFGPKFWGVIYFAGKRVSYDFVKNVVAPDFNNLSYMTQFCCNTLNAFGEGSFSILKFNEKKENPFLLITAKQSTFAEEAKLFFGPQEQVDYFLLGVFVGFLELITKKKLYGYEINCKAQKGVQNHAL